MNIKQILEELETLLEHANRRKSGLKIDGKSFKSYKDKIDFIRSWHNSNPRKFYIEPGFRFTFIKPFDGKKMTTTLNLLYGSGELGISHIIQQRNLDYLKPSKDYIPLTEEEIWKNLYLLEDLLQNQKVSVYTDFDKQDQPYYDRVLFYDNRQNIFYCIALQTSSKTITYLHTMYKPTDKHFNRIIELNKKWSID